MQEKLMLEKNINWNDLPAKFKRGTYVQRKLVSTPFSDIELENLPEKHRARKFPNESFERHVISVVDMPIFSKIQNKVDVIFNGQNPILYADK
jgi:tRNA(His) 5'-end guanylyltransferase